MAHCSLTSSRSASPSGPKASSMLARISSTVCWVRRVGACMKWTISPEERSAASDRPLPLAWVTPSSVKGTFPLCEAILPCRTQWILTVDNRATPLTLLGFDQGESAGRGALYPRELVEGSEEPNPWREISQVHETLDQRDDRAQDRAMD